MTRKSIHHPFISSLLLGLCAAFFSVQYPSGAQSIASAAPDFTREVRPILSRHCFKCHGPDDLARKGNLRLDVRESAIHTAKSGSVAIVPGNPGTSELVKRLMTTDSDDVMPPPETKQPLTVAQIDVLKRWIQSGAEYRNHWSFEAPRSSIPKSIKNEAWPQNTLDRFILARLEKEGLEPGAKADPISLIRRLYLDLIGMSPLPDEVESFQKDYVLNPRTAVERRVDNLLASPRYGERWARRWLDLARYADTNGYEKDRNRSIWPYRDWVIRSLNADMPFDLFTIWQLAGDLMKPQDLPPGTSPLDPLIATGFHRNTMLNEEGGIDPLEFRFHAMTDRVSTTGATWLGLTLQCAQCHTHKYDPIPHREYYQLMACLNNADEPEIDLPNPDLEAQHQSNLKRIPALLVDLANHWPVTKLAWSPLRPVAITAASGETATLLEDQSALFPATSADKEIHTFILETTLTNLSHLRLEGLTHESLPSKGPGRVAHGNFVLSEIRVQANPRTAPPGGSPATVKIVSATADAEQKQYPVTQAFDGKPDTGWGVHAEGKPLNANHHAEFRFEKPISHTGGTRLTVTLEYQLGGRHTLGRARISVGVPAGDALAIQKQREESLDKAFRAWLETERQRRVSWTPIRPSAMRSNLPRLELQADDSILASGDITKNDLYKLQFDTLPKGTTAIRLEVLPDDRLPAHGPGLAYYEGPKGDFFLGEFEVQSNAHKLKLQGATESYSKNNFGGNAQASLAMDGDPQTGWSCAGQFGVRNEAVFQLAKPLTETVPTEIRLQFGRHFACSLGRFRLSITRDTAATASGLPQETRELLALPDHQLSEEQRQALRQVFLLNAPELATERAEIDRLRQPPKHPTTLVLQERPDGQMRPTFIHKRGEFLQPTESVHAGVLSVLNPLPKESQTNRLTFARWLVARENPLTSRVTVNRAWQAFFGKGLVRTTEDFGLQGEAPSHPELLDWLALEFMNQGWSFKKLHRLIATSATYQLSSKFPNSDTGDAHSSVLRDPDNRLLSRFPRTRLEAEVLRDSILRSSGLLSDRMGGPGVYPPQPEGITEVTFGQPKWPASQGEDRHRRSVYTFLKRTAPFAFYNTFDAPSGEACVARREQSNTPLQALTIMNDVLLVESSQALGRLASEFPGNPEQRLQFLFQRCLVRHPQPEELQELLAYFQRQLRRFETGELDPTKVGGVGPGNPAERAAWTALARVLLNLDESVTKG